MTTRIREYKKRVLTTKPDICLERARAYTKVYRENPSLPVIIKRAKAIKLTLEQMTIRIEPEDLLAGNHSSKIYGAPIFPEYAVEWITKEINEFEKRSGDAFFPSEETKEELLEMCEFWKGKTTLDKGRSMMTEDLRAIHEAGIIRAEGNLTSGDAHIAIKYDALLEYGIAWYMNYISRLQAEADVTTEPGLKAYHLYEASLITLEGVQIYIERCGDTALELAQATKDAKRKGELLRIHESCLAIKEQAPTNFFDGLQLTTIFQILLQVESNGHSLSLGRMDQYLYPLFKKDSDKGVIQEDEVMELLENLWIKLVSMKKIRSWSHTRFSAGGPLYQNVTIGGQKRDGSDAVNPLSYLILKSVGETALTQPNLSVRFHKDIPQEFLTECIEVIRKGFGMPAFNNDSVVIPALVDLGVSKEDALDYSAIGCIEVAVPGKWGYRCTGKHFLNFMRVFLAALRDGKDSVSGKVFHQGIGSFENFTQFDQVMEAWKHQLSYYMKAGVAIDTAIDVVLRDEAPDILCSIFVDDCLQRGLTIHEGGSTYDFVSGLQVGIANLADSLSAIKKLVFEDKRFTPAELLGYIDTNFEGKDGEIARQIILNYAPKYGNDDPYVDDLLVEAYQYYIKDIKNFHTIRQGSGAIGCQYFAGTSSISGNVPAGAVVPATPDGRKAGLPLAEGASPSSGSDIFGPTAVMKSISKLPTADITGGVLLNQKVAPALLESAEKKEKLMQMLHTFFDDLRGWHIQYNVVDRETLLAAQKNPEAYHDLVVRVAGYSAFFTNLSPETQNDIIARTEQTF